MRGSEVILVIDLSTGGRLTVKPWTIPGSTTKLQDPGAGRARSRGRKRGCLPAACAHCTASHHKGKRQPRHYGQEEKPLRRREGKGILWHLPCTPVRADRRPEHRPDPVRRGVLSPLSGSPSSWLGKVSKEGFSLLRRRRERRFFIRAAFISYWRG